MIRHFAFLVFGMSVILSSVAGCQSTYHADRGALFGGLTGAGVGALVGKATGNPLAGAALGAGIGSMTGSAIGGSLDEIEARNRAEIEARLGHQVAAGAVSVQDVIGMTRAGVSNEIIVNHVKVHGVDRTLQTQDLIELQRSGVGTEVIKEMQKPSVVRRPLPPAPVIVEEYYYDGPWGPQHSRYYGHSHHRFRPRHRDPNVTWGFSFSNDH